MAKYQLLLPKMGESVSEATVVKWTKQIGEWIEIDDIVLEIATDKVDSEVPSPVAGKLLKQLFEEDEVAQMGDPIAIIEIEGEEENEEKEYDEEEGNEKGGQIVPEKNVEEDDKAVEGANHLDKVSGDERFYSPLVKSIAAEEGISAVELAGIVGSGLEGRLSKQDILEYVSKKQGQKGNVFPEWKPVSDNHHTDEIAAEPATTAPSAIGGNTDDEIIEMDRMRKMIADHMVNSVKIAPHVCSFVEADVTNIVNWRNKHKVDFEKREGTKITYTPIFIEAVAKAIRDFPMVNVSVNGTQIIKKKEINIGMAAALPSGNLIVPVIKNADQLNLVGISKSVNDLAERARGNKLKPDETQEGTFTITNIGSFGNIMGTPIINQPQVAILAIGAITKKPAVLETEYGDVIAIRHKLFLSLSYDHRVVDGALGGMFVRRIADYLEAWDVDREY